MENILKKALRQYRHNHGKGGFVFAYDKYTVDCIFANFRELVEEIEDKKLNATRDGADAYQDCADMVESLLGGE